VRALSKEPNDILVMTTCKCREHGTNLVMTRTWFEEQLANKIQQGVRQERERILKLLQEQADGYLIDPYYIEPIIALIKAGSDD
jgi:hypothetical protein